MRKTTKKAEYLRTLDSIWSEAEFFIDGLGNSSYKE